MEELLKPSDSKADSDTKTSNAEEKRVMKDIVKKVGSATWAGTKKVAKSVGSAAGAAGAAVVAGGSSIATGVKNDIKGSVDAAFDNSAGNAMTFFFIIAVFTHLIDAIKGFTRPGFMIYVYVGLIIFAFFFLFHMRLNNSDEVALLIVILLAYSLPFIPDIFRDNSLMLTLSGLLFLLPVLPIYIGMKCPEDSFIAKAAKIYLVVWTIILAFYLITDLSPEQTSKATIKDTFAGVRHVMTGVGKTFEKVGASFNSAFNQAVAKATGQAYEGEEESKVGISLENIKSLESRYNTESIVYVEAKISAENIKEKINIRTKCTIDNMRQGSVVPSVLTNVTDNYENIIDCEFGRLPAGNYEAKVQAIFEFESTSDIEYTFVNDEIKSDQYARLNIDPVTIATYTGGPVELGLPSLAQPLRIDADRADGGIVSYPFGVSLKNKWPQGKVTRGIRYLLSVPIEVELEKCSREPTSMTRNQAANRNEYVFEMNTQNAQDVFDAITCRMKFVNARELLGIDLKSVKTFAARAKYEYMIEGSTQIIVESMGEEQ